MYPKSKQQSTEISSPILKVVGYLSSLVTAFTTVLYPVGRLHHPAPDFVAPGLARLDRFGFRDGRTRNREREKHKEENISENRGHFKVDDYRSYVRLDKIELL